MKRLMFRRHGRTSGTSGIEFALVAPVLILGVLATADVGFSIHESFRIDQVLRNGAEAALTDPGESRVEAVLAAVGASGGQGSTLWDVDRYHICPESPGARMNAPIPCANNQPTAIFYQITGVRAYSGILLPPRDLTRSASIQVR